MVYFWFDCWALVNPLNSVCVETIARVSSRGSKTILRVGWGGSITYFARGLARVENLFCAWVGAF